MLPSLGGKKTNVGDDIAGTVHEVGGSVQEFKKGDRVAAFHRLIEPWGAHAEYAIAPATTTFFVPPNISFEEASTIPLASMTAALALYQHLGLPPPWRPIPPGTTFPLLIYGGASAVGAFALKFAKLSNCSPIITVAGNGIPFVESLKIADTIIDYRSGGVTAKIKEALKGKKLYYAFDAVSGPTSFKDILDVIEHDGESHLNMVDRPSGVSPWPPVEMEGVIYSHTFASSAYGAPYSSRPLNEAMWDADFAYVMYRYISLCLADGRFSGHPYEVIGGLDAIERGTVMLSQNKVSSKKLVYR